MRDRDQIMMQIRNLPDHAEPILIVGAGINGIGLYRDLALQDIPAVLIDKGDFSSGTSAAPSRLIHGGLRYLETGEFALVRESVIERNHLMRNAPHLVKIIPVWVPAFSWMGGLFSAGLRFLKLKKTPGAKGIFVVKLGLMFFDQFGRTNQTTPRHRLVSQAESRQKMPGLSKKIRAIAEYFDARLVHPERLALELIKDAEADCPNAIAAPYVSLLDMTDNHVTLKDEINGETFRLKTKLVINCAGPWVDEVNQRLGITERLIGGTRGSHLLLQRPDLAAQLGDGMLYFETRDFRACLVYALDTETILLGTTDIRDEDPDTVRCSDDEIAYLFDVLEQVMPGADAKESDITFAYSGLRPLPFSGASATGAISRDHVLRTFEADPERAIPVLALVGGKWTTYRACAEQIADVVLSRLDRKRLKSTLSQPIGGAKDLPTRPMDLASKADEIATTVGLPHTSAETLLRRYGSAAGEVARAIMEQGMNRIDTDSAYWEGEIRWIAKSERITRLADIVLRRTLLPFENGITLPVLEKIASVAAGELGWDDERRDWEIHQTTDELISRYRVKTIKSYLIGQN